MIMKVCTACNASYLDENLSFCPVDGAILKRLKEVSFDQIPFSYEPGGWSDAEVNASGQPDSAKNSEPLPVAAFSYQPPPDPQNISAAAKGNANQNSFFWAVAGSIGLAAFVGGLMLIFSGGADKNDPQVSVVSNTSITLANGTKVRAEPIGTPFGSDSVPSVSSNTAVVVNAAPSPAKNTISQPISRKLDFTGVWQGKFNNEPTVLSITTQTGDTFFGTLSKKGYIVKISGKIDYEKAAVVITETDVLQTPANSVWHLGTNNGTIADGGKSMGGTGKDKNGAYPWSFTKE